jgi:gas vesicle protein
MSNSNKIIVGLLGAAVAGVAIGMLLAPEKGSEARKKIAETANDLASRVGEWISTGKDKAQDVANTVGQKAQQAADRAQNLHEQMS